MPSDLSQYLASRYLVADPKPAKKRKRKQDAAAKGLLITDDNDDDSWGQSRADDDHGDDGPLTVSGATAEFRKTKKSNWKSVGGGSGSSTGPRDESAAAADAIIASAAAEHDASRAADDEMPVVEGGDGDGDVSAAAVKMSDGTHAGLQSAAAVAAQLRRRREEEMHDFARHRASAREAETVYRDATGRRIDVSMKRAEARRAAAEAEERERQAREALKGEVQQEEARRRRERLEEAKTMAFARGADDEEMNRELKQQQRWNDPMMQFMESKDVAVVGKGGGEAAAGGHRDGKGARRPVYAGAAPPNRYGIRPGYRWDGVDRSNGFEGERFKQLNRRERNRGLDYAWQMDE